MLLLLPSQIQPVRIFLKYCQIFGITIYFRKGIFLTTAVIICLSFLTVGVFARLSHAGLLPIDLAAHLNFIPMAMVILAYIGYGLGFGVIPSLLAAESIPVNIR